MLLGEYNHTLDDKNRLTMPVKFKSELGNKIIVTRGLDGPLFVYSQKEWENIMEKFAKLSMVDDTSRRFSRFFLSNAVETQLDKAGRVVINESQKDFADLDKDVTLIGVQSRVELWDTKTWKSYSKKMEKDGNAMASKLGEIGVL